MPIEHRVDPGQGILFVTRSGSIDTQDEHDALDRRRADPLVQPGIRVLVDCCAVDPADSTEVVHYLADSITALAAHLQCGPVAIVVSTDVQFGMARMYAALTDLAHPDTEVFRAREDALTWLRSR
ncbi:MAG: hypothetical protein CMQ43_11165 [Gammaproteobacteria bacterium]|nr:hypothetical protein [Gammaproteobacteria bacterium]|tara:strand:- start:351 stop:725 length:375 start_codon:yes stop_codon:yes gene_type:complete